MRNIGNCNELNLARSVNFSCAATTMGTAADYISPRLTGSVRRIYIKFVPYNLERMDLIAHAATCERHTSSLQRVESRSEYTL